MPIRKLPPEVANRIAAGEVIERPASIVKELIENSLDSGARRIDVEIERAGLALIRVRDDGCGLAPDDLPVAFERHATSKLTSVDDLWAISTLGFRGEALPSVAAACAEVELLSRRSSDLAGARLLLRDGAVVARGQHGSAAGTTVTARDIFANQPARRAFLRSEAAETRAILSVVSNAALAHPAVAFSLKSDGRDKFRCGGGDLQGAATAVYGRAVAADLLPAESEHAGVSVRGLIAAPGQHRASRGGIVFVVNGRPVISRSLSFAVEEAYQGLLPRGRHPIAVLHISLAPDVVDVNVHPAKAEVRFRDERAVFGAVQRAVRAALLAAAPAAATTILIPTEEAPSWRQQPFPAHEPPVPSPARSAVATTPARPPDSDDILARPAPVFPPLRAVGQVQDLYIIAEGPDGMYLIDQHAAHERVLFERFRAQRESRHPDAQLLLAPLTLDLSPRQALLLSQEGPALTAMGLEFEPFGEAGVIVRALPRELAERRGASAAAVLELIDALGDGRPAEDGDRASATLACHASVRAGTTLSADEQRALLRLLEGAAQPRTCPHGRPTMVHLSADQLARGFGRR